MASQFGELRQKSRRLVKNIKVNDPIPAVCISQDAVNQLVEATNLSGIADAVNWADADQENEHELVVWVEACLRNPCGFRDADEAVDASLEILKLVVNALKLPAFFNARSFLDPAPPPVPTAHDTLCFRLKSLAALRLLLGLAKGFPTVLESDSLDVVSRVASFTDHEDPWIHPESPILAMKFLQLYSQALAAKDPTLPGKLVPRVLVEVTRPLFRRVRKNAITAQGRKAVSQPEVRHVDSIPENEEKAWKFRAVWVTTVFEWCVQNLEAGLVADNWPLIIPPLLAMIDDEGTEFKTKGCRTLRSFLPKVDAAMLLRTGLGEVFEQALLPLLNYLPSLTPEDESLRLLQEVYPSLRMVAQARYPDLVQRPNKLQCYDKMLREGILRGGLYAADYPNILSKLMTELGLLIQEMGIEAVKHLKTIVPLLTDNLCNPFIAAHPALLSASVCALQALMLSCWPRIPHYQGELLKAITVCWLRLEGENAGQRELKDVREGLQTLLALLQSILVEEADTLDEIARVLRCDSRLASLMPIRST